MKVDIGVNEAIRKGRLQVNLPAAILFFVFLAGTPFFLLEFTQETWVLISGTAIGAIVGFGLAWMYSAYAVVRWKIWAYDNVKNVHELKQKAIEERVMYPDGHWSERLGFETYDQRQKLKQLERKFQSEDQYRDDIHISRQTEIFIAKKNILLFFMLGVFLCGTAISKYMNLQAFNSNIIALGMLGICFLAMAFHDLAKGPRIIISASGIKLHKKESMPWEFISNETIGNARLEERYKKYLMFDYKGRQEKVLINNLQTNVSEMEHLLRVYRLRFENNKPFNSGQ